MNFETVLCHRGKSGSASLSPVWFVTFTTLAKASGTDYQNIAKLLTHPSISSFPLSQYEDNMQN